MGDEMAWCWYCDREFQTVTDAWDHMDDEHPVEAAADLEAMNADIARRMRGDA